jgi:hypothetical protein
VHLPAPLSPMIATRRPGGRLKVMSWIVRCVALASGRRPLQGEGVADDVFLAPGN